MLSLGGQIHQQRPPSSSWFIDQKSKAGIVPALSADTGPMATTTKNSWASRSSVVLERLSCFTKLHTLLKILPAARVGFSRFSQFTQL